MSEDEAWIPQKEEVPSSEVQQESKSSLTKRSKKRKRKKRIDQWYLDNMEKVFQAIDIDGKGYISINDLERIRKRVDMFTISTWDIQRMIAFASKASDRVSKEDFKALLEL